VPCRIDDVSAALCYYQPTVFHHQSGGHKIWLRLICPFEKNMETPFRDNRNDILTNAFNHENTHEVSLKDKFEKHEMLFSFRGFVFSCFRDGKNLFLTTRI